MRLGKLLLPVSVAALCLTSLHGANADNGERLFVERCAMCHGADAKGSGPLAHKSDPPTPDLTTPAFRKRLADYPGVIVSSVILRPNGDLIPRTLKENGYRVPPHAWTVRDFRDLNDYMSGLIHRSK
ncbi:cytochrome C [Azospirillum sp. TSH100]|uniref:c-type cytochrome n=1 Tax=Azospirillum sp. TSH100 TaxID=652764 RepID=UPI000D610CC2|nr:cytochrome c [Azospirillum sp. TSH100]PWC85809.1 cytochrome C [Azospirillum sp. TSH100]QCG87861.1 cytochrome c [Azospirillum sp. TSH100]